MDDLGIMAEGLFDATDEECLVVFAGMARMAAREGGKAGKVQIADRLAEIAVQRGLPELYGDDAVQKQIARAFDDAGFNDVVPDDWDSGNGRDGQDTSERQGRANGHAKPIAEPSVRLLAPFPIDETTIPVRNWLIPGLFMRRQVTVLVAPSGSGKSLLTLQWAISCALGINWAGWHVRQPCKVLILNSEDDYDEVRRRLVAACHIMDVTQELLCDRIFITERGDGYVVAQFNARTKTMLKTPLLGEIIDIVKREGVDLIFVDPFAETFEGDENSNSELKWAGILWREVARQTDAAAGIIHHTKKYASGMAGDVDAARGAGALIGIARVVSTLFPMTPKEAETMEIAEEQRHTFLRYDDAKANLNLKSAVAKWFTKETITLANGDALPGDLVGALKPYKAPDLFTGITQEQVDAVLGEIDQGIKKDGQLVDFFTLSKTNNSERYVGKLIMRRLVCNEDRAAQIIKTWQKSKTLIEFDYISGVQRKKRKGCGSKQLAEWVAENYDLSQDSMV